MRRHPVLTDSAIQWRTLRRLLTHPESSGSRRAAAREKPRLRPRLGRIERVLQSDRTAPKKPWNTTERRWVLSQSLRAIARPTHPSRADVRLGRLDVAPPTGAWIETAASQLLLWDNSSSHLVGRAHSMRPRRRNTMGPRIQNSYGPARHGASALSRQSPSVISLRHPQSQRTAHGTQVIHGSNRFTKSTRPSLRRRSEGLCFGMAVTCLW